MARKPSAREGIRAGGICLLQGGELLSSHGVDLVAGPDAYLDLPNLITAVENGESAINIELSTTETYRDVIPSRIGGNNISGYISIMRGCNNFCSYCIVPYTRGRERSREPGSILNELRDLQAKGFKEVILLGQNVNSYNYVNPDGSVVDFARLLEIVADAAPEMRVRFTTSHPKDMSDEIIAMIDSYSELEDVKMTDAIKFKNEYLIKRVIGLPGETIEYKDNNLYINGELIEENFNHKVTSDYVLNEIIPDGYYFVAGDNRVDSLDSRVLGLMKEEDILGKTSLVLFPFNRFGVKK